MPLLINIRSSSGNAAVIILLLLVAAFVIVAMNEQEFRGVPGQKSASQKGEGESVNSGILDSILSTFRGTTSERDEAPIRARMKDDVYEEQPTSKTPIKKKVATKPATKVVPKQHDDLGRRDRAELNELLEKVNP